MPSSGFSDDLLPHQTLTSPFICAHVLYFQLFHSTLLTESWSKTYIYFCSHTLFSVSISASLIDIFCALQLLPVQNTSPFLNALESCGQKDSSWKKHWRRYCSSLQQQQYFCFVQHSPLQSTGIQATQKIPPVVKFQIWKENFCNLPLKTFFMLSMSSWCPQIKIFQCISILWRHSWKQTNKTTTTKTTTKNPTKQKKPSTQTNKTKQLDHKSVTLITALLNSSRPPKWQRQLSLSNLLCSPDVVYTCSHV